MSKKKKPFPPLSAAHRQHLSELRAAAKLDAVGPEETPKRARLPGDVCDEECKPGGSICSAYTDCQNRFAGPPKVAFKKDAGKLPMELIPTSALRALAEVLAFGAKKYSPNGWRNVTVSDPAEAKWSRLAGAILRHYTEWMEGKKDPDTGLSPLKHLLCDVAFLIEFEERDLGTDDRWTKP